MKTSTSTWALTSNPLMNGEIVSGNSGATGPRSFQFCTRPSLIAEAWALDVVKLKMTASEFASWGHRVVVSLSRYRPREGSQKTSLYLALRADALLDHALAKADSLSGPAKFMLFIQTWHEEPYRQEAKHNGELSIATLYSNALASALCPPCPSLPQSLVPVTFSNPELSTLASKNWTAFV